MAYAIGRDMLQRNVLSLTTTVDMAVGILKLLGDSFYLLPIVAASATALMSQKKDLSRAVRWFTMLLEAIDLISMDLQEIIRKWGVISTSLLVLGADLILVHVIIQHHPHAADYFSTANVMAML